MSTEDGRLTGLVKWFDAKKAFGFISMADGDMDVFVHANQLRKSGVHRILREGEQVTFKVELGEKGRFATDITVVDPGQPALN
jgi:CspA family cold shock protein